MYPTEATKASRETQIERGMKHMRRMRGLERTISKKAPPLVASDEYADFGAESTTSIGFPKTRREYGEDRLSLMGTVERRETRLEIA